MRESTKTQALVNCSPLEWNRVFSPEAQAGLHRLLDIDLASLEGCAGTSLEEEDLLRQPANAGIVIGSWGCTRITERVLDRHPSLKLIVHAAGSIKPLYDETIAERSIRVCTAAHINAQPVAEFCLGIILTSLRDLHGWKKRLLKSGSADAWRNLRYATGSGYYRKKIGLIEFGAVSRYLMKLLRNFDFEVYIASVFVSPLEEEVYGCKVESLEWIMTHCDVVSLHSASTADNQHMINRSNLGLLKDGAVFINTARGALVNEEDLVEILEKGRVKAYIDVTDPEPPPFDHPFFTLPNCFLTPHIAGSLSSEVPRMGDYVLREVTNFLNGEPLENELNLEEISTRA